MLLQGFKLNHKNDIYKIQGNPNVLFLDELRRRFDCVPNRALVQFDLLWMHESIHTDNAFVTEYIAIT